MSRVKGGPATRQRRKRVLKLASGYYGDKSKKYRIAKQAVMKSLRYAYRDRKAKKRDFRKIVDCAHQRSCPHERYVLQHVHFWSEKERRGS
jgi:ribosomal protein L20